MTRKAVGITVLFAVFAALGCFFAMTPALAAAKYTMKYAASGSDAHPATIAVNDLVKFVAERSNGEMEIKVFRNGQLGGDRQVAEGMQIGTIELGAISSSIITTFEPKMGIFDFPFLFKTQEAAYRAMDGEVGQIITDSLAKKGLRIIGFAINGYRHVTNNKLPIYKPDDLKGIKIRTQENPIFLDAFKAFGASPTPMSFGELYTALQQKTVDAQENPISLIYSSKLYEVQDYISLTGHVYAVIPLIISEPYFKKLPPEYQEIMLEAGKFYADRERALVMEKEAEFIEKMREAGVKINELTPEQKDEFIKRTAGVYEKFEKTVGKELLEKAIATND